MTHGTVTGYSKHRCKCELCAEAWRIYQRRYMRERYQGLRRRVPVTLARRHIVMLMGQGMTATAISLSAGLHGATVGLLLGGKVKEIRRTTSEAILGVGLDDYPPGTRVRAAMSRQIISEMRGRLGMSYAEIADYVKLSDAGVRLIMDMEDGRRTVRPETHLRLVVGYWILAREGLVPADVLADDWYVASQGGRS
jgi:hypothetical protein